MAYGADIHLDQLVANAVGGSYLLMTLTDIRSHDLTYIVWPTVPTPRDSYLKNNWSMLS